MDVASEAFEQMKLTLGPGCEKSEWVIVEALLAKHGLQCNVGDSILKGKVRLTK